MADELHSAFAPRVLRHEGYWKRLPGPQQEEKSACDLIIFSKASSRFSLDRVMSRLGSHLVAFWASEDCIQETGEVASPACAHVNSMWERSYLMMRGYCTRRLCASLILTSILQDPNVLELRCEDFASNEGSNASMAEFGA